VEAHDGAARGREERVSRGAVTSEANSRVKGLVILLQVIVGHLGRLELDQLGLVAVLDVLEVVGELLLPRLEVALLGLDLSTELGLLRGVRKEDQ
jgi:hypothetical protein